MARSSVSTPRSSNQDVRISRIRLSDKEAHGSSVRRLTPCGPTPSDLERSIGR